ncbi:MAG: hypothetical protein NVSMB43_07240 [Pseudarthrobacter sp.]
MVAAWAAGSVPLYTGISTCPAFSSTDIADTAAAAASWSRCSGPHPSGLSWGSGEDDAEGGAAVGRSASDGVPDGAAGPEPGAEADDAGPVAGTAVQAASKAAAAKGRVIL